MLYAQSGGVTAVINTTAWGVFAAARRAAKVGGIFAGEDGILGVLRERLVDVGQESDQQLRLLRYTPGGAFGSSRFKLPDPADDDRLHRRLLDVFRAHDIGYFLFNGGNDSQDTTDKIARFARAAGWDVKCVGIPKTVDNDLAMTDCCPGYGSVAKYVATTVKETRRDVAAMAATSTRLFILEVMGRHAGWITAAGALAGEPDGPVMLALPEIPFNERRFLAAVRKRVTRHGYCCVVASEGLRDARGRFLSERGGSDAFAHAQLGGVAGVLAGKCKAALGVKYHWALADYMQRAARHLASATDLRQAEAVGRHAVRFAVGGQGGVMPAIVRDADKPYRWHVKPVPLAKVANTERKMPRKFISNDGFFVTPACLRYLAPLIAGEDRPPYRDGLPVHAVLRRRLVPRKLPAWKA